MTHPDWATGHCADGNRGAQAGARVGESYWRRYKGRRDPGNVQPGDGVKYHGRNYIELIGRASYKSYGQKLGIDLENTPDLAMALAGNSYVQN